MESVEEWSLCCTVLERGRHVAIAIETLVEQSDSREASLAAQTGQCPRRLGSLPASPCQSRLVRWMQHSQHVF